METKERTLEDVRREMVDCISSVHAKFDIMASATEAGDESEVSLRTIWQLSSEGLEIVEKMMDLDSEQQRLMDAAK